MAGNSRIYILEERRYRVMNETLQLVLDLDTANPIHVVDGLTDLQLTAVFTDGSEQATLGFGDVWGDLAAVRLQMSGVAATDNGRLLERAWTTEVLPRNVLSY